MRADAARRADPGVGSWDAPEGSEEWAKRFRLAWLSAFHDLPKAPRNFLDYYKRGVAQRIWTTLTGPDGKHFKKFDDFCRAPEPWGFGKPWTEIKPFLVGLVSERELDLATVDPPRTKAGPGRGHTKELPSSGSSFAAPGHTSRTELRAINRAPDAAKDLYRKGLLGQREAAKLGPRVGKKVPPEKAGEITARVAAVAQELASEAAKLDTSTEALKKQAQRALNAKARELLGIRKDRVLAVTRGIEALTVDERDQVFATCRERGWLA